VIDVSVFEVLVLIGLVLLVLALGITAFVVVRRPRKASPESSSSPLTTALQVGEGEAQTVGSNQQAERAAGDRSSDDLNARATALMASAEHTRAEAEEEARARRAEMREQRADLERREQRLSDREERLDSDIRALEERTRQLDELKGDLKAQRKKLADAASQHQAALERVAGLTAEQAKAELIAAVEHDAKRQAVLVARDIERQAVRDA
jgi:ribonucrease Y